MHTEFGHMKNYTDEQLESRRIFRQEALKIERPGIRDLLDWLDISNFYDAPASTRYHLACKGGLAEHSINVLEVARKLNTALGEPVHDESVTLVSLFHDLGKHQYYGKDYYQPKYLKSGKPAATPYGRNQDLIDVPHEISSVQILTEFIDITEDEAWAIYQHNGMYGDLKYKLQGKETKLQQIVHNADMWTSRFIEERGK